MKKIIIICLIIVIVISTIFMIKPKTNNNMDNIKLAEVAHSIFYAPMYVAIENKYFEEENINIDLILTPGADKVSASILSGDVQIGFAGPESTIYIYKGNESDYLQTFAGLTKRDGQFIVSRKKEDFKYENLLGKEVIVGRKGGMPSLNFLNALDNEKINSKNVNVNYSVEYANLSSAFISGIGDYVNLFEPNATKIESMGLGYIVESVGSSSGVMPYTTFFAKKSYIDNNKDLINRFRQAINKGLDYVKKHTKEEIAKTIQNQFNDLSLNELETIIQRYKDNDSYFDNTFITKEAFQNLEDVMIKNNLLDKYVEFNNLVIND